MIKKKFQEVVNRNEKGFTIFEVIIVIVIVGIMAAIAIPKMNNVTTVDLYATARQVKSDIRLAQQLATSKFMNTTITFVAGSNTYAITRGNPVVTINKSLPVNSRVTFDAGYSFQFRSSGIPTATAGWTVGITSGGSTEQIVVSNITGRVTIP